ncbi:MAG TPA: hypothetical protein VMI94_02710 [Bryobacteraceae bacterium]|nr:hypothetical protein [Bryobacteraceae bacterium]
MRLLLSVAVAAGFSLAAAGPIRLDPKNPHYFLFHGKTVALITSGEHYGAVMNADFDYRRYLATLESEGMNYTRLFGGSYREVPAQSFGIKRNTLAPAPGRYIAPWALRGDRYDLDRWNPEYIQRFRDFLADAQRRAIVVEVTLFSSYYQEMHWKISPFNPANNVNGTTAIDWKRLHTLDNGNILPYQERYVRQLVRQANPFDNVIFEIQNEPWSDRPVLANVVNPYLTEPSRDRYPNSVDLADPASIAWQARVAEWIASEEGRLPNRHLIAQNYCNFLFPVRELVPGANIVNFHYVYPQAVALNYGLGIAISYDESGFLGNDDASYRRQAWNFMLAGGSVFDSLDYSFSAGHEDGTDAAPNGPGGGSPALRRQLRILSDFLGKLPLETIVPDTRVVKHAAGATPHALSSPGGDYGIYFDGGGLAEVELDLPPGAYSGEWVNVETGNTTRVANFASTGNAASTLHPPAYQNGIALRLTRTKP